MSSSFGRSRSKSVRFLCERIDNAILQKCGKYIQGRDGLQKYKDLRAEYSAATDDCSTFSKIVSDLRKGKVDKQVSELSDESDILNSYLVKSNKLQNELQAQVNDLLLFKSKAIVHEKSRTDNIKVQFALLSNLKTTHEELKEVPLEDSEKKSKWPNVSGIFSRKEKKHKQQVRKVETRFDDRQFEKHARIIEQLLTSNNYNFDSALFKPLYDVTGQHRQLATNWQVAFGKPCGVSDGLRTTDDSTFTQELLSDLSNVTYIPAQPTGSAEKLDAFAEAMLNCIRIVSNKALKQCVQKLYTRLETVRLEEFEQQQHIIKHSLDELCKVHIKETVITYVPKSSQQSASVDVQEEPTPGVISKTDEHVEVDDKLKKKLSKSAFLFPRNPHLPGLEAAIGRF